MQNRKAALAVGAALIVVAVVLFVALQGGSGSPPLTKGVTVIHLKNGMPIGGIHDVTVNKGGQVQVTVDSDIRATQSLPPVPSSTSGRGRATESLGS